MQGQLPSKGNCQVQNVVYKDIVATQEDHQINHGTSEGEFKLRFNNHSQFRNQFTKIILTAVATQIYFLLRNWTFGESC